VGAAHIAEVEKFLKKHAEDDDAPVAWESLAKERIEKYKKAGLVLRGMRYRENLSQKELAKQSGVNQNEISKIENGKRVVGIKVAKRLAHVLNIDYKLLTDI
jgi:DNA-binding XRE family transcriptional regulator